MRRLTFATALCLWVFACASGAADENPNPLDVTTVVGSGSSPSVGAGGSIGAVCASGLTLCNGQCVNLQASASDCSGCGIACAAGTVCSNGVCSANCANGQTLCSQSCTTLLTDASNCGQCNTVCQAGSNCVAGQCKAASTSAGGATGTSTPSTPNAGGSTPVVTTPPPITCNSDVTSKGCTVGTMSSSGSLSGQYGVAKVTAGGKEYVVQVNEWGSTAAQTLSYGNPFMKMTTQNGSNPSNDKPTGFPSMFIGNNSGNSTSGSGLPKAVSSLGTVLTTWNWADGGTAASTANHIYNVAYDVWFSTGSGGDSGSIPSGGYLMVWYYAQGCQPVGSIKKAGLTIPGIPGCWNVWVGAYNGRPVISYMHQGMIKSLGFDLNLFIKDAYTNAAAYGGTTANYKNWYLSNIFAGYEIWKGGVGLQTTSFCAEVN